MSLFGVAILWVPTSMVIKFRTFCDFLFFYRQGSIGGRQVKTFEFENDWYAAFSRPDKRL